MGQIYIILGANLLFVTQKHHIQYQICTFLCKINAGSRKDLFSILLSQYSEKNTYKVRIEKKCGFFGRCSNIIFVDCTETGHYLTVMYVH